VNEKHSNTLSIRFQEIVTSQCHNDVTVTEAQTKMDNYYYLIDYY